MSRLMDKHISPADRTRTGVEEQMHEHGMQPGMGMMQQQEMLMMEMWNTLNDDQKKILMKRMVDAKIMMKEGMIKHLQFKIETMKMVKKMLDEC
jgi:hypothetical protein